MEDLIKALQIFLKYTNLQNPTNCEHDAMIIYEIGFDEVDPSDREELDKLGFFGLNMKKMKKRDAGCHLGLVINLKKR